jgi:hypothetical protein
MPSTMYLCIQDWLGISSRAQLELGSKADPGSFESGPVSRQIVMSLNMSLCREQSESEVIGSLQDL